MARLLLAVLLGAGAVVVWRWVTEVALAPITDLDEQYDTRLPLRDPYLDRVVTKARLHSVSVVNGEWRPQYVVFETDVHATPTAEA